MDTIKYVDASGKKRHGIQKECPVCKNKFITRIDQPYIACGKECRGKLKRKRIVLQCSQCKKLFEKKLSKLKCSKSGFYFCSRLCKDKAQCLGGIKEIMPPHYGTRKLGYRDLFEKKDLVCIRCGYKEFVNCVVIHHIDENRSNNDKDNLMPLCFNCHWSLHWKEWELQEICQSKS